MLGKRIAGGLMLLMLFCFMGIIPYAHGQSAGIFPDMRGIWHGTYHAAFPKGHSHHGEERKWIEMELEIYKQEENLIWAENRWRIVGAKQWHREQTTGAFSLNDTSILTIVEIEDAPEIGSTGLFDCKLVHDQLFIMYKGIGNGITFSTVLKKRAK